MGKHPHLSIVIPCYNEEQNIKQQVLTEVEKYLTKQHFSWEVLIVDDGSTDQSVALIKEFIKGKQNFHLVENQHGGKAVSVTTGVLRSTGDYILFTDFDQATPIGELDKLVPYFAKHDVIIGSRSSHREGAPLSRLLMAKGFITLRSLLLGMHGISDTQCGFKVFRREVGQQLFKQLQLYRTKKALTGSSVTAGFDVELLFLAKKRNFRIAEVPVVWHYKDTRRVNPIRDSIDGLVDLVRIRFNDWQGIYGK